MSADERRKRLAAVMNLFKTANDLSEQKVGLAVQSYEAVDRYIRQLDSDLKRMETDMSSHAETPAGHKRKSTEGDPASKVGLVWGGGDVPIAADMPVDPNEPTYCLCHQVSYGEMIGCDNPDVRPFPLL